MKKHRVWAEVNLGQLARNMDSLRAKLGPDVKQTVVVKADAYGHGAVPVAKTCLEHVAFMLAVGDSNEAIHLRESGILAPILVLGALIDEELSWVVSYDIRPTIHAVDRVAALHDAARRLGRTCKVHVKVDTGLGRLGASPYQALEIVRRIAASPHLELEGLSTHFASASTGDLAFTERQLRTFAGVLSEIEGMGIRVPFRHAANAAGALLYPDSVFNMVRPGASLYGIDPGNLRERGVSLTPILALKTQVAFLKGHPSGASIGYNRTYTTQRRTRIATLPVGYNDGYPHRVSNQANVIVRGRLAPVAGTVTMDYTTIDVGAISDARVGDEVVLVGRQGDHQIRVEELAAIIGTTPYEITCGLGRRVRRVYGEQ